MKLDDLQIGDILISNGTFRGVVTKTVHENSIALVVTGIDALHNFLWLLWLHLLTRLE